MFAQKKITRSNGQDSAAILLQSALVLEVCQSAVPPQTTQTSCSKIACIDLAKKNCLTIRKPGVLTESRSVHYFNKIGRPRLNGRLLKCLYEDEHDA